MDLSERKKQPDETRNAYNFFAGKHIFVSYFFYRQTSMESSAFDCTIEERKSS